MGDNQGTSLFIDEAKSMSEIGTYHDHIVNLQGVTYSWNSNQGQFTEVLIYYNPTSQVQHQTLT